MTDMKLIFNAERRMQDPSVSFADSSPFRESRCRIVGPAVGIFIRFRNVYTIKFLTANQSHCNRKLTRRSNIFVSAQCKAGYNSELRSTQFCTLNFIVNSVSTDCLCIAEMINLSYIMLNKLTVRCI